MKRYEREHSTKCVGIKTGIFKYIITSVHTSLINKKIHTYAIDISKEIVEDFLLNCLDAYVAIISKKAAANILASLRK
ncbi:MAG: hypothetical protein RR810_04105 [Clostridia bacterium]